MRVIAGNARRTVLVAPDGQNTRPTADRAKEGLFNILAPRIRGARFLDTFCGSGAIGVEALSRGASQAVFVDCSQAAIRAVRSNLSKTRLSESAVVLETSAKNAIARLAAQNQQFDIIFIDPPYGSGFLQQTLAQISQSKLLTESGIIIAETDTVETDTIDNEKTDDLMPIESRTYGRTKFMFFEWTSWGQNETVCC
ncbi:MAG: 16S rRNA (guanine(966)-N(2))-methyltransferase RsmD [Defluviitaleaceae bacterium]|nr:16S rRNA (guanine(966)-N(2))-methyltransferase RsmD [Defluviitaleaceae bacterium]